MKDNSIPAALRLHLLFLTLAALVISAPANSANTGTTTSEENPALLLANIYRNESSITFDEYWISEKLDGVRAYWNGKHLVSRQGNIFNAPEWFTKPFPDTALDGELWSGRGTFEKLSGRVRRQSTNESDWQGIQYMIFDLPGNTQTFNDRLKLLMNIVREVNAPHIKLIRQFKVTSHEVLMKKLDEVVQQGGEGLMLHAGASLYKSGRSDDLLKLKKHFDAEAVVIKHLPGKGKYTGLLGAIEVETSDGKRFKIGSGFSDAERKNPPPVGSTITYKYFGLTSKGKPRFASFIRQRNMQ